MVKRPNFIKLCKVLEVPKTYTYYMEDEEAWQNYGMGPLDCICPDSMVKFEGSDLDGLKEVVRDNVLKNKMTVTDCYSSYGMYNCFTAPNIRSTLLKEGWSIHVAFTNNVFVTTIVSMGCLLGGEGVNEEESFFNALASLCEKANSLKESTKSDIRKTLVHGGKYDASR
jgi:hypothetical protein